MNKVKKRIMGRWLEGFGIALLAGSLIAFHITEWKFWYYIVIPIFILSLGAWMRENNYDKAYDSNHTEQYNMEKRKPTDKLSKIVYLILLFLIFLVIGTNLLSPYYDYIKPFNIDINLIYLIVAALAIPFLDDIATIKYKDWEVKKRERRSKEEIDEINKEAQPLIEHRDFDLKLKWILDNKRYNEGFSFYRIEFEKELHKLLKKRKLKIDKISLTDLIDKSLEKGVITAYTYKGLKLFMDARNRIIHLPEDYIHDKDSMINILLLASSLLKNIRGNGND